MQPLLRAHLNVDIPFAAVLLLTDLQSLCLPYVEFRDWSWTAPQEALSAKRFPEANRGSRAESLPVFFANPICPNLTDLINSSTTA